MKRLVVLFRKIIFAFLFVYAFNKLAIPLNIVVPLNFITIGLITLFGVPGLFMLVIFSVFFI